MAAPLFSQVKLGEYRSSMFGKTYTIKADEAPDQYGEYSYYIDVDSENPQKNPKVQICLTNKEIDGFLSQIKTLKENYTQLRQDAVSNSIEDDYYKELDCKFDKCQVSYTNNTGTWSYYYTQNISPSFHAIMGRYLLVLSNNGYIDMMTNAMLFDGFKIAFSSLEEIDAFLRIFENKK